MERLLQTLLSFIDQVYFSMVDPCFRFIGQGLESILLKPLDLLHVPLFLQVVLVAGLTASGSFFIRRSLKVSEKELDFKKSFTAKKEKQQNIDLLGDWKTRDAFYRATDHELDDDFNIYLAQRFAHHTMVYLLPIFLVLFWLDNVLPVSELVRRNGMPFLVSLPGNSYEVQGLPVTFVFLAAYVAILIAAPLFQMLINRKREVFLKARRETAS